MFIQIIISHFNVKREKSNKLIWFHASSIGELNSIIPIIENLNTNSKNLLKASVYFDSPASVFAYGSLHNITISNE